MTISPSPKKVIKAFGSLPTDVPLEVFHSDPYKALISTVMSSRTKDETTLDAANKLFKKAPDIYKLSKLKKETIEKLIYPVGFYKTKAKNLLLLADKIINEYDGMVPNTREELMSLPGVGRKTANLVLNRAFDKPAIAVDTHVHRISNIIGWAKSKSPEETEKQLMQKLPKKYWKDINVYFVSVGRQFRSMKRLLEFLDEKGLI